MNYPLIARLLSYMLGSIVLAFVGCIGLAFYFDDNGSEANAVTGFAISAVCAAVLAGTFLFFGRRADTKFFRKEALCVIGTGWILASLVGSLPYFLILESCRLSDAVFESTSGLTTTGASVFTGFEAWPRSLLFWRQLSQWIGGIGIVVFFVAILGSLGAGAKILFSNESTAKSADLEQGRIQQGVLHLFYLYLGLSGACVIALKLSGMDWYDAVCHMFTTIATGGFSTRSDSIAAFANPAIEWSMIVFMILGSTSFLVLLLVLRGQFREAGRSTEVRAYFGILIVTVLFFAVFLLVENGYTDPGEALRHAAFQVVSIASTSGFATADFDQWPLFTTMTLLALMIVGGCSSSTAGGMKVIRLVVGIRICLQSVERSFRSHVVRPTIVNGKPLDQATCNGILVHITMLGLLLLLSIPAFALFESGHTLAGGVSAVLATFFNIGPGFAEFGPTENFADLRDITKCFLSLLMIMGRIELFAVLVLFSPSLWKKLS